MRPLLEVVRIKNAAITDQHDDEQRRRRLAVDALAAPLVVLNNKKHETHDGSQTDQPQQNIKAAQIAAIRTNAGPQTEENSKSEKKARTPSRHWPHSGLIAAGLRLTPHSPPVNMKK
jgi:single-stranded DNA-binding protein